MKIDPVNRTASIGARELSEFEICRRGSGRPAGQWRTEAGRLWHQTIQGEEEDRFEREKTVSGTLERDGWTLHIDGRCDLYRVEENGHRSFGEIKTVTDPLPLPVSELRARFPSYFRQLATYLLLSDSQNRPETSFLLLLNIDTGIRQTIACAPEDFESLETQIGTLISFLEFTAKSAASRSALQWKSFREHPRAGQVEASQALAEAENTHRVVGFQAPTGFGKTRIVLEHALEAIRAGKADRILYLTGKTSGQEQACIEARTLFPDDNGIRSYRMRNHREHWSECPLDGCLPDQCAPQPEERSPLPVTELLQYPGHAEDAWNGVCELAEGYHFCPYALSRGMMPFSELWIADYNYLFSPSSRHIFNDQPGFDPGRTWLLIDEAHNLPDRTSSALGGRLESRTLENTAQDLRAFHVDNHLRATLKELAHEIDQLTPEKEIDTATLFLITDLIETATNSLAAAPLPWRELTGETVSTLQALESARFLIEMERLEPILWSPRAGQLEWIPLKVGPWISESLSPFAQTVFFSATLEPFSSFIAHFGLSTEDCRLVDAEPGQSNRFHTAIDARARTTLRERKRSAAITAEALVDLSQASRGCVAAFFPSFEYAETISAYVEATAPHLRTELQPRNLDASEREVFARTAPLANDILFLMLGGSFAEAVDAFGGVIETAMIVSPGLPELSVINRIRMDAYPDRDTGFHEIFRIPGMRRVNQAIGRLVRSLEHRATIVLHGRRFLEPEFRNLLRPDLGEITVVQKNDEWRAWLDREHPFDQ
tara:strand:+ start:3370 stop:5691 length:2322 start_codon:yes stop_codon:yes gene_type:complete